MASLLPSQLRLTLALSLVLPLTDVSAAPIFTDYNIAVQSTSVLNDRIGNSRFFSGPNTDRLRISVFTLPSPDSDAIDATSQGSTFRSTNGSDTTVTVTHGSFGAIPGFGPIASPRSLGFVGLTSGLGGARNEYTTTFNLANPGVAARLDAWAATPFVVTVQNPRAPNGTTSVTYNAPDYNRNALPPFVTDLTLTGGGLQPTLDWSIPSGAVTPTRVSIQIRRIDAETADRSHITAATLVHSKNLPAGTTSYTINEPFSNSGLPGFPVGLEDGKRYEISVQLDYVSGGELQGRSRTFFEFSPLASGNDNVSVFLPSVGPDGVFKFDVEVQPGEKIAIDPDLATGYEYQIGAGDPLFRSVTLPNVGDGLYDLYLYNGTDFIFETVLSAGAEFFFPGTGVDRFRVLGIETSAGLDPSDTTAFITTLTFAGAGRFTGTMTPLVTTVPEPATLALLGLAFAGMAVARPRREGRRPAAHA